MQKSNAVKLATCGGPAYALWPIICWPGGCRGLGGGWLCESLSSIWTFTCVCMQAHTLRSHVARSDDCMNSVQSAIAG